MAQPLAMFLLLLLYSSSCFSISAAIRVELTHVDSDANYTKSEIIGRAVRRTRHRMAALAAARLTKAPNNVGSPLHPSTSAYVSGTEYLMELSIGTPPVPITAIADTGSSLIWTQCRPCARCFPQPTPLYDSSASSTFSALPCTSPLCLALGGNADCSPACDYVYLYADGSFTAGRLGTERFTFGGSTGHEASLSGIGFGCGSYNEGDFSRSTGIVGLGRGALSLVSQLGSRRFSYCLTSYGGSKAGPLLLGSSAVLASGTRAARSTPFLHNPATDPSLYFLSWRGISVGTTFIPVPSKAGAGGMVIDSGSTFTLLDEATYKVLKRELRKQVKLQVRKSSVPGLDFCFAVPSGRSRPVAVPKLVIHFEGADMELGGDNYMYVNPDEGLMCLTVLGGGDEPGLPPILGNYQQQNMQILYDLDAGMLSFVPTQCDRL